MAGVINQAHPQVSFCPSSLKDIFSIQHDGKTHNLPMWQQAAIVVSGIVGILLFGIGVLFSFGLSYYFRTKLVEQLNKPADFTQTPALVVQQDPEPETQTVETERVNQQVADTLPAEARPEGEINVDNLAPKDPIEIYLAEREAERNLEARVAKVRGQIKALSVLRKVLRTKINGISLEDWSKNGRYFVSITHDARNYILPEFDETALPKGIYCLYTVLPSGAIILQSEEMNQVMIDEFGKDNIYHMIICTQTDEFGMYNINLWMITHLKKIHNHTLILYSGMKEIDIENELNKKTIKIFGDRIAERNKDLTF